MRAAALTRAAALLLLASPAAAQPLFEVPGRARWVPVDAPKTPFVMVDAEGYGYRISNNPDRYVDCFEDADLGRPGVQGVQLRGDGFRARSGLIVDRQQAGLLIFELRTLDETSLRVMRVTCGDVDPTLREAELLLELSGPDHPFAPLVDSLGAPMAKRRGGGDVCFGGDGLYCFDPEVTPVTPRLVFDPAEAGPADPWFEGELELEQRPIAVGSHRITGPLLGPGDRVLLRHERRLHYTDTGELVDPPFSTLQIWEVLADDSPAPRTPQYRSRPHSVIRMPTMYWPEIDAWVAPAGGVELGDRNAPSDPASLPDGDLDGWGLFVLWGQQSGYGYVSYTRPLVERFDCTGCVTNAMTLDHRLSQDGERLLIDFRPGIGDQVVPLRTYALELEPDRFDLDDDGLEAEEEARLGTSDQQRDSDGDGAEDAVERRLFGTDPADPADAPPPPPEVPWAVAETGLIQLRLPDLVDSFPRRAGHVTGQGPLCVDGACYGPSGRVLTRFDGSMTHAPSLDGEHVFYLSGADLRVPLDPDRV